MADRRRVTGEPVIKNLINAKENKEFCTGCNMDYAIVCITDTNNSSKCYQVCADCLVNLKSQEMMKSPLNDSKN